MPTKKLAALVVDQKSAAAAPAVVCPVVDLDADAAAVAAAAQLAEDPTTGEVCAVGARTVEVTSLASAMRTLRDGERCVYFNLRMCGAN